MAQCEKILPDGRRCSNRAVPGASYCQSHSRITFKPVAKSADTAPPPVEKRSHSTTPVISPQPTRSSKTEPAVWKAVSISSGHVPHFPGIKAGERGLLVAPQGIIWLEPDSQSGKSSTFNRLVRLLGSFSQAVNLAGQVQLSTHVTNGDYFVQLSPTKDMNLAAFYDTASAAARMVDARLYIGQTPAYVQYRDDRAPAGYDVLDFGGSTNNDLLLVAHWGSRTFTVSELRTVPLDDFCLRISPYPTAPGALPETVYALAPVGLYQLLARYLRAHNLRYSLARFQSNLGEHLLFEIIPRSGTSPKSYIPAFVLEHLSRLPRLTLLTLAYQTGKQKMLLHWAHQFPLHFGHTTNLFPTDGYILMVGDSLPNNLLINPSPQFFDGDSLARVHVSKIHHSQNTQPTNSTTHPLKLTVLLRHDNGSMPPISALLLYSQEISWLRQLLYRLPGEAFGDYRLCLGNDMAMLLGGNKSIRGIPFGFPFRRLNDSALFIPLRSRFVPDIPWAILNEALQIDEANAFTFLTDDTRLDLPQSAFIPLSRVLMADTGRPLVKFSIRTDIGLPALRWTPPPAPEVPIVKESSAKTPRRFGLFKSAPSQKTSSKAIPEPHQPSPPPPADPVVNWRKQAESFETSADFLAAAMCYILAKDETASARCLQRSLSKKA